MKEGDTEVACQRFRESFELKQTIGTKLNLAICEEDLGNRVRAWELYAELLDTLPSSDRRHTLIDRRHEALESQLAYLSFELDDDAPPDSRVVEQTSGRELPRDRLLAFEPGEYRFKVSAPNRKPREYGLSLRAAEARRLSIAPSGPGPSDAASRLVAADPRQGVNQKPATKVQRPKKQESGRSRASPPVAPTDPNAHRAGSASHTWGLVAFGTAGAALVTSGVAGMLVLRQQAVVDDNCSPLDNGGQECEPSGISAAKRGKRYSAIGTAAFALGMAATGVGVYLMLPEGLSASAQLSPAGFRVSASRSF